MGVFIGCCLQSRCLAVCSVGRSARVAPGWALAHCLRGRRGVCGLRPVVPRAAGACLGAGAAVASEIFGAMISLSTERNLAPADSVLSIGGSHVADRRSLARGPSHRLLGSRAARAPRRARLRFTATPRQTDAASRDRVGGKPFLSQLSPDRPRQMHPRGHSHTCHIWMHLRAELARSNTIGINSQSNTRRKNSPQTASGTLTRER